MELYEHKLSQTTSMSLIIVAKRLFQSSSPQLLPALLFCVVLGWQVSHEWKWAPISHEKPKARSCSPTFTDPILTFQHIFRFQTIPKRVKLVGAIPFLGKHEVWQYGIIFASLNIFKAHDFPEPAWIEKRGANQHQPRAYPDSMYSHLQAKDCIVCGPIVIVTIFVACLGCQFSPHSPKAPKNHR